MLTFTLLLSQVNRRKCGSYFYSETRWVYLE